MLQSPEVGYGGGVLLALGCLLLTLSRLFGCVSLMLEGSFFGGFLAQLAPSNGASLMLAIFVVPSPSRFLLALGRLFFPSLFTQLAPGDGVSLMLAIFVVPKPGGSCGSCGGDPTSRPRG